MLRNSSTWTAVVYTSESFVVGIEVNVTDYTTITQDTGGTVLEVLSFLSFNTKTQFSKGSFYVFKF